MFVISGYVSLVSLLRTRGGTARLSSLYVCLSQLSCERPEKYAKLALLLRKRTKFNFSVGNHEITPRSFLAKDLIC